MKQSSTYLPKCHVYGPRLFLLCLVPAVLMLAVLPAHAGDNEWTALGPYGLAHVRTLIFDPHSSTTLYLVADDGHSLYRSSDGGASWSSANEGLPFALGGLSVSALIVDPKTPGVLYASFSGIGIYKSTDGGASWSSANKGLPGRFLGVNALAVDPQSPATLYAAVGEFGVYKSSDGGGSWSSANIGLPIELGRILYLNSLVVDPKTPSTLYARVSDDDPYNNTDTLYKSTDGGASWSLANMGLPIESSGVLYSNALTVDPKTPATVYASMGGFGIYKSTDGGASWSPANKGLPTEPGNAHYVNALVVDSKMPAIVYASVAGYGVYKSTDGGASWSPANQGLPAEPGGYLYVYDLILDPQTPSTIYAVMYSGLYMSTDEGASWSPASFGGVRGLPVSSLVVNPRDTNILYAGAGDGGIHRSMDGGNSWQVVSPVGLGSNVRSLAIDPKTPSTIYAAMDSGLYGSTDGGDSWLPFAIELPAEAGEFLVVDPQAPATLFVGGLLGLYKTTDGGDTWFLANSGLPQDRDFYAASAADNTVAATEQPTDEESHGFPTLHGLVINPQAPATLYVIVAGRGIYKSTDAGKSWQAANSGLPAPTNSLFGRSLDFFELKIDAQAPNNLYVAVTVYDAPDCPECTFLYKSTNDGESWSLLPLSLASSDADPNPRLHSLAVDGQTASLLYAVTNSQFLSSVDGGQSWYPFGPGLPVAESHTLVVPAADPAAPGRLFLAGGRGVYVTDLSATLTVEVVPLGTPPADDWTFTDPEGKIILPAAGGKQDFGRLPVGVRRIQMTPQANFTPRASCTHGIGSDSAWEAHLVAGADVRCRFFNIGDDAPHVFLPALSR